MKKNITYAMLACLLCLSGNVFAGAGGDPVLQDPDGVFTITPVLEQSCIAVKIPLISTQALAGVKWYNNDGETPFAKLLVASGQEAVPPLYADGVVAAEGVFGENVGWSEYLFSEAYGSLTDALYLIFQFPDEVEGEGQGEGPGIGYIADTNSSCIFLSAEGEDWVRLKTEFSLLVEPILVERVPGLVALSMSQPEVVVMEELSLPEFTELGKPFPNPFNPMTTIAFSLAKPSHVDIRVFDVRGRLVKILADSYHEAGRFVVQWTGKNTQGLNAASGVYFVRMETEDHYFSTRVSLLK